MSDDKRYEIVVIADTNDADYVTQISTISEELLLEIQPVIEAIKAKNATITPGRGIYNWPSSEYRKETVEDTYPQLTEDQIECFRELCPYGEYGIHTIKSVEYYPEPVKVKLL